VCLHHGNQPGLGSLPDMKLPIRYTSAGTRAPGASSALTVRARDAHRVLPERRHTVRPQDRHIARSLTPARPLYRPQPWSPPRWPTGVSAAVPCAAPIWTIHSKYPTSGSAELSVLPVVHSYARSGISTRSLGLEWLGRDWLPDVIADADGPAGSSNTCFPRWGHSAQGRGTEWPVLDDPGRAADQRPWDLGHTMMAIPASQFVCTPRSVPDPR